MGKLFEKLQAADAETQEDRVVGGYEPLPSGIYDAEITLAYAGKAQNSDAQNVTVHAQIDGKEYRETIYITNRNGEPFFVDKNSGKQVYLPGYSTINDLCLFATEAPLTEQETETKTIKLYNFDERKELPTEVPVLTGLIGQKVKLAILRCIDDKRARQQDGSYAETGETRVSNEIDKVLHPETSRTVNEYLREVDPGEFADAWIKRNEGKDRNRAKGVSSMGGSSGSGTPAAIGGQRKSLFGK